MSAKNSGNLKKTVKVMQDSLNSFESKEGGQKKGFHPDPQSGFHISGYGLQVPIIFHDVSIGPLLFQQVSGFPFSPKSSSCLLISTYFYPSFLSRCIIYPNFCNSYAVGFFIHSNFCSSYPSGNL